ncbi:MAG: hypothetical protein M5U28_17185 [Sandaracinaceae bacterium]|nr:hypothetical protein [Sandaracinaceae bacterium]
MKGGLAQAPSMRVGRDGFVVGWHGALGPCVARFETWTRESPLYARALGHAGADLPVVPALWLTGGRLVAVWCEGEGRVRAGLRRRRRRARPAPRPRGRDRHRARAGR